MFMFMLHFLEPVISSYWYYVLTCNAYAAEWSSALFITIKK